MQSYHIKREWRSHYITRHMSLEKELCAKALFKVAPSPIRRHSRTNHIQAGHRQCTATILFWNQVSLQLINFYFLRGGFCYFNRLSVNCFFFFNFASQFLAVAPTFEVTSSPLAGRQNWVPFSAHCCLVRVRWSTYSVYYQLNTHTAPFSKSQPLPAAVLPTYTPEVHEGFGSLDRKTYCWQPYQVPLQVEEKRGSWEWTFGMLRVNTQPWILWHNKFKMIILDFFGGTNHILSENSEVERNPFLCFRHKIRQILIEIKHIYSLGDMLSVTLSIMTVVLYILIL